ncbi:MAG: hypothetical protein IPP84_12815 [Propionivibrio sp.]|uniref:hypothetical protein n=1 Tax=Propionivibrio sp. TaxID=2212460 RepID=UPI0025E4C8DF|nr:hypothetical protein [Propionivibrio sp.]MBL0208784.1 hypothetical protein [Propionivibrio sp.]
MMELRFEINGRRVDPRNIGDALTAAVIDVAAKEIKKKVGACRCPEHGKSPTVVGKGRSADKLTFEVEGCCEKLIREVKRRL